MKEWEKGTISSKTEIIPGYAFASTDFKKSGIPIIKIANVKLGSVDLADNSTQYVDEHLLNSLHPKYRVNSGDILISLTGSHLTQPNSVVGRVGRYRYQLTALVNQRAAKIGEVKGKSDKDFVYHLLSTHTLRKEIALLAHGAANQANVSHKDIEKIKVFWPPLPIQRKIAAVLSAYDDLIENNNRRIAILEKMAEELYREWFVRLRFPGHEKVRIVKGVPEGWEVKKLSDIVELAYGKALKEEDRIEGIVPVYGSSGIVGFHNAPLVNGPGIIIGRKGNVGSVTWSYRDFFPIDTAYFVRSKLPLEYLFYQIQSMNFINNDAAVPGLNREQAYSNKFFFPKLSLIEAFVKIVKPLFLKKEKHIKQNSLLTTSRNMLLSRLMSVKIDVERLDIKFPASMTEEGNA